LVRLWIFGDARVDPARISRGALFSHPILLFYKSWAASWQCAIALHWFRRLFTVKSAFSFSCR
jgi:hypothetical protein